MQGTTYAGKPHVRFGGKVILGALALAVAHVVAETAAYADLGEFKAGLFPTRAGDRNRNALDVFLQKATVKVVPITDRTADIYAKVYQALRKEGTPIPQNDMWIAASALENGADLATCDEHFRHVPMLTVIVVD